MVKSVDTECPCGSSQPYTICCGLLHKNVQHAETASQLMKSRYSAFFKGEFEYLIETHHPDYRQVDEMALLKQGSGSTRWTRLSVIKAIDGNENDHKGVVEFKAYCIEKDIPSVLHACSRFVRENKRWYYTDDRFRHFLPQVFRRNEPCWCQSGKKYKYCHGK